MNGHKLVSADHETIGIRCLQDGSVVHIDYDDLKHGLSHEHTLVCPRCGNSLEEAVEEVAA